MKRPSFIYKNYLNVLIVALLLLTNCRSAYDEHKSESKRLIVVGIDFSESTADREKREEVFDAVNNLANCFKVGDIIYLYQISDNAFNSPKRILKIEIPYPKILIPFIPFLKILEKEDKILAFHKDEYKDKLKDKKKMFIDSSFEGSDITGFLLFAESTFFNNQFDNNCLIIISDGIESSSRLNPVRLISFGVEEILNNFKEKKFIANLKNWEVRRTGPLQDISPELMRLYDDFWEEYFKKGQSDYKKVGFEIFNSIICEDIWGQ